MARVHGRKALPLPPSLLDALEHMHFVEIPDRTPRTFALPRIPAIRVEAVASNIPGDAAVIAKVAGQHARRYPVDELIVELAYTIAITDSPNQRRRS